jgi:hypothetical protein
LRHGCHAVSVLRAGGPRMRAGTQPATDLQASPCAYAQAVAAARAVRPETPILP